MAYATRERCQSPLYGGSQSDQKSAGKISRCIPKKEHGGGKNSLCIVHNRKIHVLDIVYVNSYPVLWYLFIHIQYIFFFPRCNSWNAFVKPQPFFSFAHICKKSDFHHLPLCIPECRTIIECFVFSRRNWSLQTSFWTYLELPLDVFVWQIRICMKWMYHTSVLCKTFSHSCVYGAQVGVEQTV